MRGRALVFFVCLSAPLCFFPLLTAAQNPSQPEDEDLQTGIQETGVEFLQIESSYLLPQTIFVGDQGRLVVSLGQGLTGVEPFVLESAGGDILSALQSRPLSSALPIPIAVLEKLSENPELLVKRVELERRGGTFRLLVDFIPYAPGILAFPPLEFISSGATIFALTGLELQVASILDPSQRILSDPASPLPVPGTNLLVYGTIILILMLLFLFIGGSIWGRHHFRELWEYFRRRRLIRVMAKFLRRLRQESCLEKNGNPGFYLSLLSGEFREFLSYFTGVNCRSLTAGEFIDLPLGYPGQETSGGLAGPDTGGAAAEFRAAKVAEANWPLFLCSLFRDWDNLRFSGMGVKMTDLFKAIKDTGKFIAALDRAEREKSLSGVFRGLPEGSGASQAQGNSGAESAALPAGGEIV